MLITNGKVTRNIASGKLPEYKARGYYPVKDDTPAKPKTARKKAGGANG